jgi:2-polyprenyl-3-methyl-5-hydroxy-6-metoxy-1,4-benzoquinol methylase
LQSNHNVASNRRFAFGENWWRFLSVLNDGRIAEAEQSLKTMLKIQNLKEKSFLDVGSGSGLFSLAARRLGARVHSFDSDPQSVACTNELKQRYLPDDSDWVIEEGSVLDSVYLESLGKFDVVYSWGVLHHTGAMWQALRNIQISVANEGYLFISIYNLQPFWSSYWLTVKKTYNQVPRPIKALMSSGFYVFFATSLFLADIIRGRNPLDRHRGLNRRGMSMYRNVVDWLGGLPFEVAAPEEIFRLYRHSGFLLTEMKTCAGKHGCNEYVFQKVAV